MNIEKRACIDCGVEIEVFVFDDSGVSNNGRCKDCRAKHLEALREKTPKIIRALDPERNGSTWTEPAVCKDCGANFDARYFNALGTKFGNRSGLCPDCQKKANAEREARERAQAERDMQEKREGWRNICGIPPKYYEVRFEKWQKGRAGNVDKMYSLCLDYAEKYPFMSPQEYRSLVLTSNGLWGVGKTHLAYSIVHRILDRWHGEQCACPVYCVDEPELLARIRATYNNHNGGETESTIMKKVSTVALLVLDDVGKEKVSDPAFVQRVLFRIVNNRYNNMLPIIMTANLTGGELLQHFGGVENQAIMDRLIEMCGGKFFEVTNSKSYRTNK